MGHVLRQTWAEVDLGALKDNLETAANLVPPPTGILAVVKANAYGIGAIEAAKAALSNPRVVGLAVATPLEALELREAGITTPILLLGPSTLEAALELGARGVTLTVASPEDIRVVQAAAARLRTRVVVHLKIDTGMGRIGLNPDNSLNQALRLLRDLGDVFVEGVFTHLSSADTDRRSTTLQIERFTRVKATIESSGIRPRYYHAANSAATYLFPQSHMDLVRPGIMLYGSYPAKGLESTGTLRPVLSLYSRVSHVKRVGAGTPIGYNQTYAPKTETTIATLPIGYADGYPRLLSNCGSALIRGQRFPIAGRVCMDQVMLDVGDLPVEQGELVTLIGTDGHETITADEIAEKSLTIPHEVLTGISPRVPRIYR
ncbi:MAG: alanine racemase [Bacillota bacterium]|jgi:alanine racemase